MNIPRFSKKLAINTAKKTFIQKQLKYQLTEQLN